MGLFNKAGGKLLSFTVADMHCGHCESRIKGALQGIKGVKSVKAHSSTKLVELVLADDAPDAASFEAAIRDLGYTPVAND